MKLDQVIILFYLVGDIFFIFLTSETHIIMFVHSVYVLFAVLKKMSNSYMSFLS